MLCCLHPSIKRALPSCSRCEARWRFSSGFKGSRLFEKFNWKIEFWKHFQVEQHFHALCSKMAFIITEIYKYCLIYHNSYLVLMILGFPQKMFWAENITAIHILHGLPHFLWPHGELVPVNALILKYTLLRLLTNSLLSGTLYLKLKFQKLQLGEILMF